MWNKEAKTRFAKVTKLMNRINRMHTNGTIDKAGFEILRMAISNKYRVSLAVLKTL